MTSVPVGSDPDRGINPSFEKRLIADIRSVGRPPNVPRPGSWRVNRGIQQIDGAIHRFLEAAGLVQGKDCIDGPFWAECPALLTVDSIPLDAAKAWRQMPLLTAWGTVPDPFQRLLVLEFQRLLLTAYGCLGDEAHLIVEMVTSSLIDNAIAHLFMDLSNQSLAEKQSFWDDDRPAPRFFHQGLLREMKRMLVSTYEGHPVKALVSVVDPILMPRFRWSPVGFDPLPLIAATTAARKLTDGEKATFLFSGHGECFGLFDSAEVVDMARGESYPYVKWRLKHSACLQGLVGAAGQAERLLVEFSHGEWRLGNHEGFRRAVIDVEASASGPNERLMDVAERLSECREGGLLVIVPDAQTLTDAGIADSRQLNRAGPGRVEQIAAEISEKGGFLVDLEHGVSTGDHSLSTAEYLLEQYRRKKVAAIPLSVLQRLAAVDGALIVSRKGELLGFGIILRSDGKDTSPQLEGARSNATRLASRYGVAIKVSSDGTISVFFQGRRTFPPLRTASTS